MVQEELLDHFLYEPTVGSKLVYKRTGYKRVRGEEVKSWVGNKQGHMYCTYGKKSALLHRIIWIMFNGPIPEGMVIDHINRRPYDNRIENLRLATKSQNKLNTTKKPNTKTPRPELVSRYETVEYVDSDGKKRRRYSKIKVPRKHVLGRL